MFLFLFGISSSALSTKLVSIEGFDVLIEYEQICKREIGNCLRLKNRYGWISPPDHVPTMIRKLREYILKYSAEYNVNPVAIAGVIFAEESLNVSHSDYFQNVIIYALGKNGKVLWEKMSYGIGKLTLAPLKEANKYLHIESGEDILNDEELSKIPFLAELAVKYIAVILKMAELDYQKEGYSINADVGILATLYNLGDAKKRAQASKKAGLQPRVNYFGFYVQINEDAINKILFWD